MRISQPVTHTNGRFQIPTEVRYLLQLPRDCLLHGRLIETTDDPSLVLSPIPVDFWDKCFRMVVYTKHMPGSMAVVLDALATANLIELYTVGSAVSATGEVCLTMVVAPSDITSLSEHPEQRASDIKSLLLRQMSFAEALCDTGVFDARANEHTYCPALALTPLLHLRAHSTDHLPTPLLDRTLGTHLTRRCQIPLRNSTANLSAFHFVDRGRGNAPAISAYDCLVTRANRRGHVLMIAAHPSEHYMQVSLLPPEQFYVVTADVQSRHSNPTKSHGVDLRVARALAAAPYSLNLYHASSFVVEAHVPTGQSSEYNKISRIRVIAESQQDGMGQSSLKAQLNSRLAEALPEGAVRGIRVRPLLAPLVFVATNIGERVEEKYLEMGIELCRMLKELYLCPVFVTATSGGTSDHCLLHPFLIRIA